MTGEEDGEHLTCFCWRDELELGGAELFVCMCISVWMSSSKRKRMRKNCTEQTKNRNNDNLIVVHGNK